MIDRGELPAVYVTARHVRVRRDDFLAYLGLDSAEGSTNAAAPVLPADGDLWDRVGGAPAGLGEEDRAELADRLHTLADVLRPSGKPSP